jgi:hypothetical protein
VVRSTNESDIGIVPIGGATLRHPFCLIYNLVLYSPTPPRARKKRLCVRKNTDDVDVDGSGSEIMLDKSRKGILE